MKSLRTLLLALLVIGHSFAEKVADLPAPTANVSDDANVMTAAGKAQVEAVCRDVHAKTKAQIFVVTIKSLDGEPITQFANELFHTWKIGEKRSDRGVLVLIVQDHHRWRIEVGYGLEGILPDAKAGRIGRTMDPLLKSNDYDAAAKTSVDAIAAVIAEDANVTLAQPEPETEPVQAAPVVHEQENDSTGAIIALVIICVVLMFLLVGYFRRRAMARGYSGDTVSNEPGFVAAPVYFGSDTSSSSSGNDYSSSSSDDSSSSSSSDSFSGGDGGDSGGGGADGGGE